MALTREEILALDIRVQGGAKARRELDKTADATKKAARETEKANKKTGASFKSAAAAVTKFTIAAAAIAGAILVVDRFAERADRLSSLSRGFETLTGRIGETTEAMLIGMRRASAGFVTDAGLIEQANNAMILGLPITAKSMEELTSSAIKLGRAMGIDATRSIQSMVTGIGRQSRLMLDNIGLIVNAEKAYAQYAATLGVTVEQLTDAQRKLAFYNETVKQAEIKSKGLTVETGASIESWKQLKVAITNTIDEYLRFIAVQGSTKIDDKIFLITREIAKLEKQTGKGPDAARLGQSSQARKIRGLEQELAILFRKRQFLEVMADIEASGQKSADKAATHAATILSLTKATAKVYEDLFIAQQQFRFGTGATLAGVGQVLLPLSLATDPEFGSLDSQSDFEEAERQHQALIDAAVLAQAEITDNNRREAAERIAIAQHEQLMKVGFQEQLSSAVFALGAAIFGDNKVFAIAESIVQTHLAVVKTLASVPYPANLAAAAQVRLLGTLNTAAIVATSFGSRGGGGGGAGGGGFASASAPFSPGPSVPVQGPVEIRVFFEGEAFVFGDMDEFAQQIGEQYARQAGRAGVVTGGFGDG